MFAAPASRTNELPAPGSVPRREGARPRHLRVAPEVARRRRLTRLAMFAFGVVTVASLFALVAFHVFAVQSTFTLDRIAKERTNEELRNERLRDQVATLVVAGVDHRPSRAARHDEYRRHPIHPSAEGRARRAPRAIPRSRRWRSPGRRRSRTLATTTRKPSAGARTRPRPRPSAPARARGAVGRAAAPRPQPKPKAKAAKASRDAGKRLAACSAIVVVVFGVLAVRVAKLQLMSGEPLRAARGRAERCARSRSAPRAAASSTATGATSRSRSSVRRSTPTRCSSPTRSPKPRSSRRSCTPTSSTSGNSCRRVRCSSRTSPTRSTTTTAEKVRALGLPGIGFVPEPARTLSERRARRRVAGQRRNRGQRSQRHRVPVRLAPRRPVGPARRRAGPARPRHPQHAAHARRARVAAPMSCSPSTRICSGRPSTRCSTRSSRSTPRAAWQPSSTSRPVTCSRWRRCAARPRVEAGAGRGSDERNSPLTDLFEPGSTNKLITLSWAIEHGVRQARHDVHRSVDDTHRSAREAVQGRRVAPADALDDGRHPARVVERRHDRDRAAGCATRSSPTRCARSGSGTKTAITWPGQPDGLLIDPSQYYATGKYASAIGYGVDVTGNADARRVRNDRERWRDATAAPARRDDRRSRQAPPGAVGRGKARRLGRNRDDDGDDARRRRRRAAPASAPRCPAIRSRARPVPRRSCSRAGSTPTARDMASFIGFAPADHPRFAAMVVLDDPAGVYGERRPPRRCGRRSCSLR